MTNTIHCFVTLLYSIYWLLHVSAVACHHQGAFLDPSELLEIQIEWMVYHIVCGYVAVHIVGYFYYMSFCLRRYMMALKAAFTFCI
jgi:hypothetical protein